MEENLGWVIYWAVKKNENRNEITRKNYSTKEKKSATRQAGSAH